MVDGEEVRLVERVERAGVDGAEKVVLVHGGRVRVCPPTSSRRPPRPPSHRPVLAIAIARPNPTLFFTFAPKSIVSKAIAS